MGVKNALVDIVVTTCALVLGPFLFVYGLGPWIEARWYPVVHPFEYTQLVQQPGKFIFHGWLDKKRKECEPVEIYAMVYGPLGRPRMVEIAFLERRDPYGRLITRREGEQDWGPWEIPVFEDVTKIEVHTEHRCHLFWKTHSELLLWVKPETLFEASK